MQSGQITSADDGTNVPRDDGFYVTGDYKLLVVGGTTIDATLEMLTRQGNWVVVPDEDALTAISGETYIGVGAAKDSFIRLSVTTATGTWDWQVDA